MWHGALFKQAIPVLICAALFLATRGAEDALAALFGGGVALANVQLLRWRQAQVAQLRGLSPRASLVSFYRSALERFALVALLLALGMGWIKLDALPLLVGFAAGQLAVLLLWSVDHRLRDNE